MPLTRQEMVNRCRQPGLLWRIVPPVGKAGCPTPPHLWHGKVMPTLTPTRRPRNRLAPRPMLRVPIETLNFLNIRGVR